ncbi:MAG: SUMF1/EgtB/PvdO family nonheme iron enzyme [Saprospiraceae bacterium]|nr:SUMF1/EgtB/PvdO family nonheme iron enzyme [Saprospiraceae bacterium]
MMKRRILLSVFSILVVGLQAQNPARSGTDHAVCFYVTTFQPDWPALPETKTEVEAIGAQLADDYGFTVEYVPNPKKADIKSKILELNRRNFREKDQLLLFFSMHGHFITAADRGYLIPADGKTPANDPLGDSWLSYDDLGAYVSQIPCRHVLLSLDACYSGAFGIRQSTTERSKSYPGDVKPSGSQECKKMQEEALFADSYLYFTAGGLTRTPARSRFADAWLEALGEGWLKKVIATNELRYAFGSVRNPAPEGGIFSRKTNGGDFVFVHKSACSNTPVIDKTADKAAWQTAKNTGTLAAYRKYAASFPNGEFRPLADQKIREIEAAQKEEIAWEEAKRLNTREAYDQFLQDYPGSDYKELASLYRSQVAGKNTPAVKEETTKTTTEDLPGFVFLQGGDFKMPHSVTLSDFYVSRYEITVKEYLEFANSTNSNFPEWKEKGSSYNIQTGSNNHYKKLGSALTNSNHPIVGISWLNAVAYCNWRSEQDGFQKVYSISGSNVTANWNANGYRLPTEAEWEYAARSRGKDEEWAGTSSESSLSQYANASGTGDGYEYTAPVGSFKANSLGLFDMSGNVWEWCWDWYGTYPTSSQNNPHGPDSGSYRVLRGGSWNDIPSDLRCANRSYSGPVNRYFDYGFRLARAAR